MRPRITPHLPRVCAWGAVVICLTARLAAAADPGPEALEFFEKRIRPVLSEQCYKCHSSTSEKLKGGLMLDSREALLKGGDTGPSVVPGNLEKSLLVSAIRWSDPDLQMPPKHKLEPAQEADLEAWVKAGAAWPQETAKSPLKKVFDLNRRRSEHWCWQPFSDSPLPAVADAAWARRPLDRFILAGLERAGLAPNPEAEKATLLRRASFDLIGLPPTPVEIEAFLADASPEAFAKVVDRLLASPRFGERWARHWLDLVRYAESRGHEFDPAIPNAWEYRDYVIRAFNADVPYNLFALEHLAGDLIPPRLDPKTGANESILGTGFWFLNEEVHSPVDIRQDEADRLDNRLDVMGKTFLGLTIGCARCHDHKFDAISQQDYYALSGYLISSGYRQARFESLEQDRTIAEQLEQVRSAARPGLLRAIAEAERPGVSRLAEELSADDPKWAAELAAARSDPGSPLHTFRQPAGEAAAGVSPLPTSSIIIDYAAPGAPFIQDGASFGLHPLRAGDPLFGSTVEQPLAGFSTHGAAVRDEAWKSLSTKTSEPDFGELGRYDRAGKTLRTPELTLGAKSLWYLVKGAGHAYAVANSHLLVKGPLHGGLLHSWKSEGDHWHWVEHPLAGYQGHRMHVELSPAGEGEFSVAMVVQSDTRPELPASAAKPIVATDKQALAKALQNRLTDILSRIAGDKIAGDAAAENLAASADWLVRKLDLFCPPGSPERQHLAEASAPFIERQAEITARIRTDAHTAPAMFDGTGVDNHIFARGQAKAPGALAPRRFLEAIAGPNQPPIVAGSGRLRLAQQVVDPTNPLTARVIVNRVWHHLFGRGIVPTTDNFGVLGEAPANRELLDYLSWHFVHEQQWSLKSLIRELMLSRTYQMASAPVDPRAEQSDPLNRLVHRMNVRRLESEAIRDAVLSVSGRLDLKMGGPSVPVHLTEFMDGRGRPTQSGPLDGDGRRSIYQQVRRNFLSPMMLAFDTPIPANCMGRRNVSNVPAQALILMNDPFIVEQAAKWIENLPADLSPTERITRMYLTAFSRPPLPEELADGLNFLRAQSELYGSRESPNPRAWQDFAHVLFNVKEFIYLN